MVINVIFGYLFAGCIYAMIMVLQGELDDDRCREECYKHSSRTLSDKELIELQFACVVIFIVTWIYWLVMDIKYFAKKKLRK